MTEELDPRIISDVNYTARETLQSLKKVGLNPIALIEHYNPKHAYAPEDIELNLHDYEDRIFARGMVMVKDKYFDTYYKEITNDYAKIAARYFLMPEPAFYRNCKECNFNLFDMKAIYPHVSYKMIAYRIADEYRCATTQWFNGQIQRLYKNDDVNVNNLTYRDMSRVAHEALRSPEGTYTFQPNNVFRMTSWKIADNKVQILCFWED
jgi:hypothetical protein